MPTLHRCSAAGAPQLPPHNYLSRICLLISLVGPAPIKSQFWVTGSNPAITPKLTKVHRNLLRFLCSDAQHQNDPDNQYFSLGFQPTAVSLSETQDRNGRQESSAQIGMRFRSARASSLCGKAHTRPSHRRDTAPNPDPVTTSLLRPIHRAKSKLLRKDARYDHQSLRP